MSGGILLWVDTLGEPIGVRILPPRLGSALLVSESEPMSGGTLLPEDILGALLSSSVA